MTVVDRALFGDCRETLGTLDADLVQCVVTSPPYWGLRDYGTKGQLGLEETPDEYIANMVKVFRAVRRVLRPDGTLWLNLGDSYAHGGCGERDAVRWPKQSRNDHMPRHAKRVDTVGAIDGKHQTRGGDVTPKRRLKTPSLKPKDLIGIPWRVALALQADGWYLRADIVWHKPNPMPESVSDRPTKAHEFVFLLTRSAEYFYNSDEAREPTSGTAHPRGNVNPKAHETSLEDPSTKNESAAAAAAYKNDARHRRVNGFNERWHTKQNASFTAAVWDVVDERNWRDVWTIPSSPFDGAHFAVFPPALAQKCITAGSRIGDVVLDPFLGSGTVGQVAQSMGRHWLGCEINPKYEALIKRRTAQIGLLTGCAP